MLSLDVLKKIGQWNKENCSYDLSLIPAKAYSSFLESLKQNGKNLFKGISFTCNSLFDDHSSDEILNANSISVHSKISNYSNLLSSALQILLNNNDNLRSLCFEHIEMTKKSLITIANSLSGSKISKIVFFDIKMNDSLVKELLNAFPRIGLRSVAFRRCSLTDKSIQSFVNFIKDLRKNDPKCLKKLDISENSFGDKSYKLIEDALNSKVDEQHKRKIQDEISRIKDENTKLYIQIERMKQIKEEVKKSNALFIVGDGSQEVIEKMREIELRIDSLEK